VLFAISEGFWFFFYSLFDILIVFEKFKYLICSYFIAIYLHWRVFHLLWHESFHLVSFSLPWLGALFYWWLVGFHHSKAKLIFLKKTFQWCIIQFELALLHTTNDHQLYIFFLMVFNNSLLFVSMSTLIKLIYISCTWKDTC
jgi:hypothetical protein